MIVKPDEEVLQALAQLCRGRAWELVEAWLIRSRESCVLQSCRAGDAESRQAQGALMAIDELLRNTRSAAELAARR